jgi:hypothetical protein
MDAGVGKGAPLKLRDLVVMELGSSPGASGLLLPSEVIFVPVASHQAGHRGGRPHRGQPVYAPEKVDAWIKPEKVVCIVDTSGAARTRPPGRLALSCSAGCSPVAGSLHRGPHQAPSRRSPRTARSGGPDNRDRGELRRRDVRGAAPPGVRDMFYEPEIISCPPSRCRRRSGSSRTWSPWPPATAWWSTPSCSAGLPSWTMRTWRRPSAATTGSPTSSPA